MGRITASNLYSVRALKVEDGRHNYLVSYNLDNWSNDSKMEIGALWNFR
jgi:hypothetical protein